MRKPASVSYGPGGNVKPVRSASSSSRNMPSTSTGPSAPGTVSSSAAISYPPSDRGSNSSAISPTSSSTRSSTVTTPSVPPYSSTTIASDARDVVSVSSTASRSRLSGTSTGSVAILATAVESRSAGGTPSA